MFKKVITGSVLLIIFLLSIYGCKKTTESSQESLELLLEPTHVTIYGGNDGSINLTVIGGKTPYKYQWSNGANSQDINNLIAGIYSVTVSDSDTESITDSTTITQPNEPNTVTDFDGNVYSTIKIGNQRWMAENLKSVHYSDGIPVEHFIYNNDSNNIDIYGRLYTWDNAMRNAARTNSNPSGVQGVCPQGWHIPSDTEWMELINFLGGVSVAGGKLKEAGYLHWLNPNIGATNESKFTALPAGWFNFSGQYMGIGERTFFITSWATSNLDPVYARQLHYHNESIERGNINLEDAASCRCIKD